MAARPQVVVHVNSLQELYDVMQAVEHFPQLMPDVELVALHGYYSPKRIGVKVVDLYIRVFKLTEDVWSDARCFAKIA